jgi:(E)-4-hydroxy-3-methylbut-2-enyl-diphosphate synthase
MMERRKTRKIMVGDVAVGGDAPISIQSMTKTDTRDVAATLEQIKSLEEEGCEIVRLAVPDETAAAALKEIARSITIPLIADIHSDFRLAIESMRAGAVGVRINPGNIGGRREVGKVVDEARARGIPLRIGVNSGSLPRRILGKYGHPVPEALVEAALEAVGMVEEMDYDQMKISLKASSVPDTIRAYELAAGRTDYPFHIGLTEAGPIYQGSIKSAVALGSLLARGIGDTIRVSLTADPTHEVKVAKFILSSLKLRAFGPDIVSCPTCGRCEIDLVAIVEDVQRRIREEGIKKSLVVAVMGCVVNGPGEAREADIGIALGKRKAVLFRKGEVVANVALSDVVDALIREIENWQHS